MIHLPEHVEHPRLGALTKRKKRGSRLKWQAEEGFVMLLLEVLDRPHHREVAKTLKKRLSWARAAMTNC
jgi:hypothetical protein